MARHGRSIFRSSFLSALSLLAILILGSSKVVHAQSSQAGVSAAKVSTPDPATFLVAPAISVSGSPSAVAVGDLNGDGQLDLVVANTSAGKIAVFMGKGTGKFAAPFDYSVGKQPVSVVLADVNGDGKLDVVVCNKADGSLSVLLGVGDGTFKKPVTYKTVSDPVFVAVGDLNGDGKLDLTVAGRSSQSVAVHVNDGTGGFTSFTPYQLGKSPNALVAADFDGDNHPDIATANSDGTISVLLSRGDGTIRTISSVSAGRSALSSIASGDFNHDGKADLAVTQSGAKQTSVFLGKGDGTFQSGSSITVGSNPVFAMVADVNGDGLPDLITANQSGNTFSVLLGNGDGTFQSSLDFTVGNSPRTIAAGDFNGDGRIDLAIANFADKSISIPLGNGDGTFKAARAYSADLQRKAIAIGDLDGDGKLDLVVTNFCGTDASCSSGGTVSVFLAAGDGAYRSAGSYPLGAGPLSVALADVNGDKKLDLIAVNRGDKSMSLLLGNGDGTFQSALTYSLPASPLSLAVGDFNRDGKVDLAITTDCGAKQCGQPGELNVSLGNGDSSFQPATVYPVGFFPFSIAIGDVDGDGNSDIVVANTCGQDGSCQSNGTATLMVGDGKGTFKSKGDIALGKHPSSVALGDLGRRKVLDLVVTRRGDNKVAVLRGNGDGSFMNPVAYPVGTAPTSVVVADFNGDGNPDVAVANLKDSTVSVLSGNGDSTLQPAVTYPGGVGPESLAALDAQANGHADLVAANGNGGSSPMGSDITVFSNAQPPIGTVSSTTSISYSGSATVTYGTSLTFAAKVTGNTANGTPTGGTMDFTANGSAFDPACTGVAVTPGTGTPPNAVANCTTTLLPAGAYTPPNIKAAYSGDPTYAGSSGSLATTLTVNPVSVMAMITANNKPYDGTTIATIANCTVSPVIGTDDVACTVLAGNANFAQATVGTSITVTANNITLTGTTAGNYKLSATTATTTADITQATPKFSVTSPTPITYGTSLIALTGTISAGSVCPPSGETVTITINGTTVPATIGPNCTFTAPFSTSTIPASPTPYQIQYFYGGDSNFMSATDTITSLTVNKATATVGVVSNNPTSIYGQTVSFTATVTGAAPPSAAPTGTVDFIDTSNGNAVLCHLAPIGSNGQAPCPNIANLTGGSHVIQAIYNGDNNYASGTIANVTQVVSRALPTVAAVSNNPTSTYGQAVDFTATVTGVTGQATPTGTVTFTDTSNGNAVLCNLVPVGSNGKAVCPNISNLTAGSHVIRASYSGDGNYTSGTPANVPQQVNPASPSFSGVTSQVITHGASSIALSGSICASGPVCPPAGDTVTISIPTLPTPITATATIVGSTGGFSTTISTGTVAVGSYTITYSYNNTPPIDNNFTSATNTNTTLTVNTATPKFSVTSPSPVTYGTPTITLTGSICAPGPVCPPAGDTVTISIPTLPTAITATATIVGSTGGFSKTIATSTVDVGSYTITYSYNNTPPIDNNFTSATDSTATLTVNKDASKTALVSSKNPSNVNDMVTFKATVTATSSNNVPTGAVTFTNGGNAIPECPTSVNLIGGVASCTTTSLTAPSDTIQASYGGDANFNTVITTLTQTVNQIASLTALVSSKSPSNVNDMVTFKATVTSSAPGPENPTGSVIFSNGGNAIPECPTPVNLIGGAASCTTTSLTVPSDTIQASYSGDVNFNTSSKSLVQNVLQIASSAGLTSSKNPSNVNDSVIFTATVTASTSGGVKPTGVVTFTNGGKSIPECASAVTLKSSGVATCNTSSLIAPSDTIQASYGGDGNFTAIATTLTQTVSKIASNTSVKSSVNPSNVNDTVTFTANVASSVPGPEAPTGTVTFTNSGNPIPECPTPVTLSSGQVASCITTHLTATSDAIQANYNGDLNFTPSSGNLPQTVNTIGTTTQVTLSPNPSVSTNPVVITALVSSAFPGTYSPTGTVTFTSNGSPIPECPSPVPFFPSTLTAQCANGTVSLVSGADIILATYNGDTNFTPSSATSTQFVQDFTVTPSPLTPVSVAQGYTNETSPAQFLQQKMSVSLAWDNGIAFPDALALTCSVTPKMSNGPTCAVNPASVKSIPSAGTIAAVTIGTSSATPIGIYAVSVTATDTGGPTHSAVFTVNVVTTTTTINVSAGQMTNNTTTTTLAGPSGVTVTNFKCVSVTLVGSNVAQDPSALFGIGCSFSPASVTLAGPNTPSAPITVTVSTSGNTVGLLRSTRGIFEAMWLGIPAILLIGRRRFRKLSRRSVLRILGLTLISIVLLQVLGCGGGFNRPTAATGGTPSGSYNLLIQGTSTDANGITTTYSSILPLNVAH